MRLIDADALHKSIDTETYRHTYIDQIHEVIDNAPTIDAVPTDQNLTTPNNTCEVDLISREDAIEAWDKLSERGRTEFDQVLMTLPSAEAVQGAWIDVENEPYCECSVCGAYIDNLDDNYAFCPRCGADMRGEEE